MIRYFNIKYISFCVLILVIFFLACGSDEDKKSDAVSQAAPDSISAADHFSIDDFISKASSAPDSVAALFLKKSIMEGDYQEAAEYLCQSNRDIIYSDTLAQYITLGKINPQWDSLTAFKFEMTRGYIPVHAYMNSIENLSKISCGKVCLFEYTVSGPLFVIKMFDAALGNLGKKTFDAVIDSNITIDEKRKFYQYI